MPDLISFIRDPNLIGQSLSPWQETGLRLLKGLPLTEEQREIARLATGREFVPGSDTRGSISPWGDRELDPEQERLSQRNLERGVLPKLREYSEVTFICGRRSGKSDRLAANIAVYEAICGGHEKLLTRGERGHIILIAQDKRAARVLYGYILAKLRGSELLSQYISVVRREEIELGNGLTIAVFPASFRATRGFSIPVAILDEFAFFRVEGVNVDKDVVDAIRPAQATFPGSKIIKISSPYMKAGELYRDFATRDKRPELLCIQAPSWLMNPTIPQSFLDAERERDPEYFDREYAAIFTDQLSSAFSREAVEACIISGRFELPYSEQLQYQAGIDPSGGGPNEFTVSICHAEGNRIVQDAIRGYRTKRPQDVVLEIAVLLKSYGISKGTGDRYSGQWVRQAFRDCGIEYEVSDLTASEAFLETLPLVNQGTIEILDDRIQKGQLLALERRKAKSGKDALGHPAGGHDDRANALALAAYGAKAKSGNRLITIPSVGIW